MKKINRKDFSEIVKPVLSKSPFLTIFILVFTLMTLTALLGNINFEYKVIVTFMYIVGLGFYFTGVLKNFIWYFVSLVILLVTSSITSLQMEIISPGITGINLPANLFIFFFISFIVEQQSLSISSSLKTLLTFVVSMINILIVMTTFTLVPNLNQYFSLIIPVVLSVLVWVTIFFIKNINKNKS